MSGVDIVIAVVLAANALALTLPITFQVGGLVGSWLAGLVETQWRKMYKRRQKLRDKNDTL
jgi:membrane protein implicated in regulation of membrane protease activity